MSQSGKAPIALIVAHEYAHHVQNSSSKSTLGYVRNTKDLELQADCYAGIILASIDNISFNPEEVNQIIETAIWSGDKDYDSAGHHGSAENRALAVRSGLRYGASQGKTKDAYYNYCLGK